MADTTMNTTASSPACTNIRMTYTSCQHILLARCLAHPISDREMWNTCPNARTTFQSVLFQGKCAKCVRPIHLADHNVQIAILQNHENNVAQSRGLTIQQRAELGRSGVDAATAFSVKVTLNRRNAQLDQASQQLREEVQAIERLIEADRLAAHRAECDVIGLFDDGSENRTYHTVMWLTCEDDDALWKWGMDGEQK